MTPARQTFKLDVVGDYRRLLDRKDIDAVLIATPDHWHSQQMVDAISAGKDVYVEKPASNSVPRINAMLDAYKKGKQVVQVGTHQRSWDHFMEAKKVLDSGALGNGDPGRHHPARVVRPPEGSRSARCRPASTGRCGRAPRRRSRSSRAASDSAPGTTTAAAWSPTGARTTSTSRTGS